VESERAKAKREKKGIAVAVEKEGKNQ